MKAHSLEKRGSVLNSSTKIFKQEKLHIYGSFECCLTMSIKVQCHEIKVTNTKHTYFAYLQTIGLRPPTDSVTRSDEKPPSYTHHTPKASSPSYKNPIQP
jgi:hypothetical protein